MFDDVVFGVSDYAASNAFFLKALLSSSARTGTTSKWFATSPRPDPMTKHTVLASLETEDGTQCVDFFVREDGTFGFEQYRGEHDGATRWQSLGKFAQRSFGSGQEALRAAQQHISWLSQAEVWRW